MAGFIFGNNTPWTYDQLQSKRKVAEALAASLGNTPRNVGEGLNAIGKALAVRGINKRADKRDAELKGEYDAEKAGFFSRFGGGGGGPFAPSYAGPAPTMPSAPSKADPNAPWLLGNDAMAALGKPPVAAPTDGSFFITPETRAQHAPGNGALNISMDFNASPGGGARGTEVIIPDNASPEVRAAAERYNQMVAEFAAANGITDYPVRGVRTRSENGRGVNNTVHVEPFFNDDIAMKELIASNPAAFAEIYREAFGTLPNARLIAPHGVGNDRGASSSVFGDETSYGELMANALLGNPSAPGGNPDQRAPVTMSAQNAPSGGGFSGGGMDLAALSNLAASPYATPGERAVYAALIQQQTQMMDPMYQMQLQREQLELAQMQNPQDQQPEELTERTALLTAAGVDPGSPEGQHYLLTGELPEAAEPGYRTLTQEESTQLGLPPGAYQMGPKGEIKQIGGSLVSVDMGGNDSEFDKAYSKSDADTVKTVVESGLSAQRNIGRIDQLGALLDANPTGFGAAAAVAAGEWGINTEGLDDLQAAQAMINSLVPEQRQPGSGPMSDADLALFKQSLPRLINQPGGNRRIVDTMRAIAQYDAEGAQIAQRGRLPENHPDHLSRAEIFDALQNRRNPLADLDVPNAQPPAAPADDGIPTFNPQTGQWE